MYCRQDIASLICRLAKPKRSTSRASKIWPANCKLLINNGAAKWECVTQAFSQLAADRGALSRTEQIGESSPGKGPKSNMPPFSLPKSFRFHILSTVLRKYLHGGCCSQGTQPKFKVKLITCQSFLSKPIVSTYQVEIRVADFTIVLYAGLSLSALASLGAAD